MISKSGKHLANATRASNNLNILDDSNDEKCYLSQLNESWLWHRRLGHMSFDNLVQISKKEAVRDLSKLEKPADIVCKDYQMGKQTRTSFKSKDLSYTKPFELVHTDLCGPNRTASLQGEKYFMLLIDDFSRMTWMTFLKEKF